MSSPRILASVHDRYSDEQIADFYAAGFWSHDTLAELIRTHLEVRADKEFVFDSTSSLTYREIYDQARRLAGALRGLGVETGDRVVVQLPNWAEFVMISCATGFLGAVIVPIMPIYRADEVAYVVSHSGAKVAITCEEFRGFEHLAMFRTIMAACPTLQHLVVARAGEGHRTLDAFRLEELVAAPLAEELPETSPDDPFLIVYTSGTTSRPKGCLHTVNTLRASAVTIALSLRYTDQDVQFGPSPVTHSTGLVNSLMLPLATGASTYLMEHWDAEEALHRIARYGCTVTVAATAFLQMIMATYDPARHDMSSMRLWGCAGSVIPPAVVRSASKLFPTCRVSSLYGRSENFLTTICTIDDPPERSLTSDGAPVRGASVKVVDDRGAEVPRGQPGDVAYRGPSHMLEYFRDPRQTAELFTADGFSRSGDLGVMDADGFVRITGRIKDIVIRGGMNISASELEELLAEHPGIREVAVVAMPDERLGEKVCVYAVAMSPANSPTLADLITHLRARHIATAKLPERLELVDALPVSATGKVRKDILRADIAAKLATISAPG